MLTANSIINFDEGDLLIQGFLIGEPELLYGELQILSGDVGAPVRPYVVWLENLRLVEKAEKDKFVSVGQSAEARLTHKGDLEIRRTEEAHVSKFSAKEYEVIRQHYPI